MAVSGQTISYLLPTFFLMAAHILWYFSTMGQLEVNFALAGMVFMSLGEESGLTLLEPVLLAVGTAAAGLVGDLAGRKSAFSLAVLMVGLLSIFGSLFYGIEVSGSSEPVVWVNAAALLSVERFIEGFLLGLCVLLIWTELGSPKNRGRRLSLVWLLFIGYFALFSAVELGAFGWHIPSAVTQAGQQFAVLSSLIALYFNGNTPVLMGREIEMEELSLDFDEDMVKQTVDSFIGTHDIESVRSQVEILETTKELSDAEMKEILGEDIHQPGSLRTMPGVGARMEERLTAAGYSSIAQLAGETPARLVSRVKGLGNAQAEKIIRAARETIKEAARSSEKS
ncbi:MAG: helix-hairpin-helix domain-containing protein [Candidatus Thorarchaeota archaeon]|nr:helix-hairpin-helix domain-containing protein [Candidatus Thorarchaeota archaeon]